MRAIKGALYRAAPSRFLVHLPNFGRFPVVYLGPGKRVKAQGALGGLKDPPRVHLALSLTHHFPGALRLRATVVHLRGV